MKNSLATNPPVPISHWRDADIAGVSRLAPLGCAQPGFLEAPRRHPARRPCKRRPGTPKSRPRAVQSMAVSSCGLPAPWKLGSPASLSARRKGIPSATRSRAGHGYVFHASSSETRCAAARSAAKNAALSEDKREKEAKKAAVFNKAR